MSKSKVRSTMNFRLDRPGDMEVPTGASMTVPDDAPSIADMLRRFAAGMRDSTQFRDAVYQDQDMDFDDLDHEEMARSEMVERQEYIDELSARKKEAQDKLEALKKAAAEKPPAKKKKVPGKQLEIPDNPLPKKAP